MILIYQTSVWSNTQKKYLKKEKMVQLIWSEEDLKQLRNKELSLYTDKTEVFYEFIEYPKSVVTKNSSWDCFPIHKREQEDNA